jgi:hypothetical protein
LAGKKCSLSVMFEKIDLKRYTAKHREIVYPAENNINDLIV